jgi:hypothetical protein
MNGLGEGKTPVPVPQATFRQILEKPANQG